MHKAPVVKLPKNIILIQINLLLKEKWLKKPQMK